MIRSAIAATLLTAAVPLSAGQFVSPAYDQAAGMAAGKSQADAAYDGSAARTAAAAPVAETPSSAALPAVLAPKNAGMDRQDVPPPSKDAQLLTVRNVLYSAGGAAVGAGVGFALGGPLGALAGALVGLGIGFFMSRMLS